MGQKRPIAPVRYRTLNPTCCGGAKIRAFMNDPCSFIGNSSSPATVVDMSEERDTHTEEQPNEPRFLLPRARRRRQTRWWGWWVLWAVGLVIALVAIGLLVAKLYPDIWETPTRGRVATLIGIVVFLTVIIVLLIIGGASLGWTGFGGKKLWDWQGLLFVPITVALIASLLTLYQTFRQQAIETQRAKEAQQLETLRAREAKKLETIRAERAMVQAYLEHMGMLLLEENLRKVKDEESAVRLLARARTLAVLDGASAEREVRVLEFLFETQLIQFGHQEQPPVISLKYANLEEALMEKRHLLSNADLERARLYKATLTDANLSNANLIGAHLGDADLTDAVLSNADLTGAHLYKADLTNTDLSNIKLIGARLIKSNLTRADLTNADLTNADLTNAEGITKEELELQGKSFEGATMPDGSKHP
jgi:uncharacterized protein YjbI with pentapeptide repeats